MITTGLDAFLRDETDRLRTRNFALVVNQTSMTNTLRYSWEVLLEAGIKPALIFSPEHGLFATDQDQEAVTSQPKTGCRVVSLYGSNAESLRPRQEMLEGIDLLVFDIQDIGTRYYTYVNTMAMLMDMVAGTDIEFLVLDRPNPLGGTLVEGPMLQPAYRSFVGILPVPVRHGLTAGELALLYREHRQLDINLRILPMQGWSRTMNFEATGLPWIPPSPNMPSPETAAVYPGMCLLEGTNVSEGRGTTIPFLHFGAPFIDPHAIAARLAGIRPEGISFRPTYFKPTYHKFCGQVSGGLALHVTDPIRFDAFSTGVAIIAALQQEYPGQFRFLEGVYEFNSTWPAFDLLCGNGKVRKLLEDSCPMDIVRNSWAKEADNFRMSKEAYHLY